MAHYKRKRPRTVGGHRYSSKALEYRLKLGPNEVFWLQSWPRWHDKLFHTRPTRRKTKSMEQALLKGADPEGIVWPDGRKPHVYYW